jgi:hypothetical protein
VFASYRPFAVGKHLNNGPELNGIIIIIVDIYFLSFKGLEILLDRKVYFHSHVDYKKVKLSCNRL